MSNYRPVKPVLTVLMIVVALEILTVLFFWRPLTNIKVFSNVPKLSSSISTHPVPEPLAPLPYVHAGPVSKDLVVYSAYFDDRPRKHHANITMIFIEASRIVFNSKLIVGCGVGSRIAANFTVRYVQEDLMMHIWLGINKYPYEQLAVECYDLPVVNGSRAFVMYNTSITGNSAVQTLRIESERHVMIPAPRIIPSGKHNFSVVVCTKAYNRKVTWLPEFLRYQKTLGVDHVHLTVLEGFIKDGGYRDFLLTDPSFMKALKENFITIQVWKQWYEDSESFEHENILFHLECIYRYRGTYDYVSLMDSDDFFTSLDPNIEFKDIIQKNCYKKPSASCLFKWLYFSPDLCGMKDKVREDGNVTAHLVPHHAEALSKNGKSVHSTAVLVDTSFHDATCKGCLLPGYTVVRVPPHEAYVAHNRMNTGGDKLKRCCM